MLSMLEAQLADVPEHRTGQNGHYEIGDAGLAAFAVFYMQSPSFLAHQRDMQRKKGHNNAQSLFKITRIPSDGQIRNLLDPVEPASLGRYSGGCMIVWWRVGSWRAIVGLLAHN